jgi:hypothetical protein
VGCRDSARQLGLTPNLSNAAASPPTSAAQCYDGAIMLDVRALEELAPITCRSCWRWCLHGGVNHESLPYQLSIGSWTQSGSISKESVNPTQCVGMQEMWQELEPGD